MKTEAIKEHVIQATPGAWEVFEGNEKRRPCIGVIETNQRIADVGDAGQTNAERNANARLMGASKHLVAALIFCRSVIEKNGIFDLSEGMAVEMADAALQQCGAMPAPAARQGRKIIVSVKDANGTYTARACKSSASSTAGPEFAVKALARKLSITNFEANQSEIESTTWHIIEAAP